MEPSEPLSQSEDDSVEPVVIADQQVFQFRRVLKLGGVGLLAVPWLGVLVGIVVLGAVFNTTSPCHCFMTSGNILTTAQEFSYVGIAALGGAMVIMTKGIDLSVGSNISLSGLLTCAVLANGHGTALALLAGLGVGLGVGLVNGFLVVVVGMQPFIATLGMLSVVGGAAVAYSQGFTLYPPQSFDRLGQGTFLTIPDPVVVMVILAAVLTLFLRYTPLGRHIYAVGGNEEACRLLGIRVKRVKLFTYCLAGVLGSVGGILLMSFLGSANPSQGLGDELNVIAAAVIGGVSLFGGQGTLFGTLLGAALVGEISDGLTLAQVPGYWTEMVVGCVILTAIGVDQLRRRLRRS
ncbi:MAG: ABC transporter permease [Acidimicrobiales bacterium]|jgi:ribose transport system permease protein